MKSSPIPTPTPHTHILQEDESWCLPLRVPAHLFLTSLGIVQILPSAPSPDWLSWWRKPSYVLLYPQHLLQCWNMLEIQQNNFCGIKESGIIQAGIGTELPSGQTPPERVQRTATVAHSACGFSVLNTPRGQRKRTCGRCGVIGDQVGAFAWAVLDRWPFCKLSFFPGIHARASEVRAFYLNKISLFLSISRAMGCFVTDLFILNMQGI